MRGVRFELRLLLPTIYAALLVASLVCTTASRSALAGVWLIVLTFPWSLVAIFVVQFVFPTIFHSGSLIPLILICFVCALPNAGLLYLFGKAIDHE